MSLLCLHRSCRLSCQNFSLTLSLSIAFFFCHSCCLNLVQSIFLSHSILFCQSFSLTISLSIWLSHSCAVTVSLCLAHSCSVNHFSRPFSATLSSIRPVNGLVHSSFVSFSFFQLVCLNLVLSIFLSHPGSGNPCPHMFLVDLVVSTLCCQSLSLIHSLTLLLSIFFSRLFSVNGVVTNFVLSMFFSHGCSVIPLSFIHYSIIVVVSFLFCKLIIIQLLLLPQSCAVHISLICVMSVHLSHLFSVIFVVALLCCESCFLSLTHSLRHTHILSLSYSL